MSGITTLCEIVDAFGASCGVDTYKHIPFDNDAGFWIRCWFSVFDFFPFIITMGKLLIGALHGSVSLYIAGIGMCVDLIVNDVLQELFKQEGPRPCLVADSYQMPALASQYVVFFVTGFLLFCVVYRQRFGIYMITLVSTMGVMAMYRRVFDRVNTIDQLFVGAFVGFIDAVWMHAFLYYVLQRYIPSIVNSRLGWKFGITNQCFLVERDLDVLEEKWYSSDRLVSQNARLEELLANQTIVPLRFKHDTKFASDFL